MPPDELSRPCSDESRALRTELAQHLLAQVWRALRAVPVAAAGVAILMWPRLPTVVLVSWLVAVGLDLARAVVSVRIGLRRLAAHGAGPRWALTRVPHNLCFGLVWGSLPVLAVVAGDRDAVWLSVIVVIGLTTVLVATTAAFRPLFVASVTGLFVPSIMAQAVAGGDLRILAMLGVVFLITTTVLHHRLHGAVISWTELKHRNQLLAQELASQHEQVSNANEQLRQVNLELAHQATHDPLTGLGNRALFLVELDRTRRRAAEDGALAGVLFLDLDRFKVVNDSHGHHVGDALLVAAARRILSELRSEDLCARLGGDEFLVLLPDLTHEEAAVSVAERIRAALSQPFAIDGASLEVGASIGVAFSREGSSTEVLRQADSALYVAKKAGRDRVVVGGSSLMALLPTVTSRA